MTIGDPQYNFFYPTLTLMMDFHNLTASLRHLIEDERASEVIVTAMFKLDNNVVLQNTGCMALTNLSADGKFTFQF